MPEIQYWVRRQGRTHGPFSHAQVSGGVQSGKLTADDEIATSQDGPWTPVSRIDKKPKAGSTPSSTVDGDSALVSPPLPSSPSANNKSSCSTEGECTAATMAAELRTGSVFDRPSGQLTVTNQRITFVPRNIIKSRPTLEIALENVTEASEVDELGGIKKGVSVRTKADDVYDFFVRDRATLLGVLQAALGTEEVRKRAAASSAVAVGADQHDGSPDAVVFHFEGINDVLEVFSDRLTITPKGILGFLNKGLKGTKEIPFQSIVAVQFKEAGGVFSGFIQFSILGGNESRGGLLAATKDENTVMFARAAENVKVKKIKDYIDSATRRLREPRPAPKATDGFADELQRLFRLKEEGVLTEEEFQQAKRKLIS